MVKNKGVLDKTSITGLEYKKYLEVDFLGPVYSAYIALKHLWLPGIEGVENATMKEDPLINTFITEEIRKYTRPKENRIGKTNFYMTEKIYNTIGHACALMKKELEEYMDYEIGSYSKDDWNLAQKLLVSGCDPLPRRRCLTRASKVYHKPYPINESLWNLAAIRNIRWRKYQCRNFGCLSDKNPRDVLSIKPGQIRIGLDYDVGIGTFTARMRELNVIIVSTALNLGAPFNEIIAL
ncbi:nuclear transcription factor Y subunit B-4-like [Hibiscus syriacus]|uniref:Nuclear transcription factor Y subunit B-4-like n=1 Tax=Hibiscus syriacus TaxID=106335 RepID=A0A6A2ZGY7_HIBSY|nr:nuclear transcription factor Y subunit B-4-like [Hibiscus syriacus]